MQRYARRAFGEFDMAGHVLFASGASVLVVHFLWAYADGIRACYERGKFSQIERIGAGRLERHECITTLYKLLGAPAPSTKHRPPAYPHIGLLDRMLSGRRIARAARDANRAIAELARTHAPSWPE